MGNVNALLNAIEKGLDSWSLLAIEFMSLEVSDIGSCSATDEQNLLETQLNLNILQLKIDYSLAATTPGTNAPVTSTAPSSAAPSTTDISTTEASTTASPGATAATTEAPGTTATPGTT